MSSDLSTVHELVSDLIKLPQTPVGWARFRLRPEQIEFFHTHGYLAGIKILTGEQVERLRLELHELTNPAHPQHELFYEFHSNESSEPTHVLFHALGAWRIAPGFHDLLWHPACTVPAAQLLGGAVRFWHDQLFCKPARHGGVVAWHQDYSYWTRRATIINVFRDGVASASDEPLLAGVPPIPQGQKIAGRFFPLLLEPEAKRIRLA